MDIWSLGVLLYEIYHKNTPFFSDSVFKIFKNITESGVKFKKDINPVTQDLIEKML